MNVFSESNWYLQDLARYELGTLSDFHCVYGDNVCSKSVHKPKSHQKDQDSYSYRTFYCKYITTFISFYI